MRLMVYLKAWAHSGALWNILGPVLLFLGYFFGLRVIFWLKQVVTQVSTNLGSWDIGFGPFLPKFG